MKLLMCRPDYYGIEYEINPWMNLEIKTDHTKAVKQWDTLYKLLQSCGAQIELIESVQGLPDLTFTANAGLFYQGKIILSHFKYKERQGETPYFKKWFQQAGFELLNSFAEQKNSFYFEGAGDALFAGAKLFAGFGIRTDQKFYQQANYLDHAKVIYCELVNSHFYHLDTCFCPLNDRQAIWYPDAFSQDAQKSMSAQLELIPVTKAEADNFACNAVVLDKQIVLPTGCPEISERLEKMGFKIYSCDMSEFLKAGGACKCLTLRID